MTDSTTRDADSTQPAPDITLSPFYHYAVNAITQPNSLVFASRYLMERWAPDLGPNGLIILLAFRHRCFHNRKTGETRNSIQKPLREIADACNLSVNTVRREIRNNAALRRFVHAQEDWIADKKRGGVRQVENRYTVAMDDPVHPDDMPRLQEEVRKMEMVREKGAEDPKERARREAAENARGHRYQPPSQNGGAARTTAAPARYTVGGPPAELGDAPATGEGPTAKLGGGACQNGSPLIDYSSLPETTPDNTQTTAPGAPGEGVVVSSQEGKGREPTTVILPGVPGWGEIVAEARRVGASAVIAELRVRTEKLGQIGPEGKLRYTFEGHIRELRGMRL